jgi:hypothetical protein
MIEHPAGDMHVHREFYRGYRVELFGQESAWSFGLSRMRFDLPSPGQRSIFFKVAHAKPCALTLAKIEIDRLLQSKGH